MSIPSRHPDASCVVQSERTFFVTSSTWDKRALLQSTRAAQLLIEMLITIAERGTIVFHDFAIMPAHFHVLMTVESEMAIKRAVQFLKSGFAFRAAKELGFPAPAWQKGFPETCISEASACLNVREYIHRNPVKRATALMPVDDAYSSARLGFDLDARPGG